MPLASVTSEAWRNLCTGTTRALALAVALAASLTVLLWADVGAAASLASKVDAYVATGASTYTLTSVDNIDGRACDRLVTSGVVGAAGAIRSADEVQFAVLPSNPVAAFAATSGLLELIAPHRPSPGSAGVYLSPALRDTLAPTLPGPGTVSAASTVTPVSVAPVTALGVYPWPDDGRPSQLQYAVLAAAPATGTFDQCWVRAVEPTLDPSFLLRSTLLRTPTDPSDAQIAQLNPRLGRSLTAATDFDTRPTRLSWLAGLGVGLLLSAVGLWLRRLELANAREVGVPALSQLMGILLETLAWALAAAVLATPALLVRASTGAADGRSALAQVGLPVLLAGVFGALLGAVAARLTLRRRPVTAYLRTR
ncbi:MAG: hypothetical protein ABI131_04410 [Nostocoides sp.]